MPRFGKADRHRSALPVSAGKQKSPDLAVRAFQ
jgi:hypothetical protein